MSNDPASKLELDNRANQLNDQHPEYHRSRGASPEEAERLASQARADSARRSGPSAPKGQPASTQSSSGKKR